MVTVVFVVAVVTVVAVVAVAAVIVAVVVVVVHLLLRNHKSNTVFSTTLFASLVGEAKSLHSDGL